ncbi:MAG TPA: hypothetical protein VN653_17225 [Anaerolineales bacterium]|nr:hypothetical protein [Anaerolineales bacterium]
MNYDPGVGATPDLSLRVSVAMLVRVVFKHPSDGEWMLALERKATLRGTKVDVKSQPFGGAIRILDLDAMHDLIGDFHFDSERSRAEQDFRLFIRPSSWSVLREFCIQHLSLVDDSILETDPARELVEEFADALKINLQPEQYASKPAATVVEDESTPTENIHAKGIPTVRVYRIFEAHITDASLMDVMLKNSENISPEDLWELALNDSQTGGKGRANAILTRPLKQISDFYLAMSPNERNVPILFEKHQLEETVAAVLENIPVPKYQKA